MAAQSIAQEVLYTGRRLRRAPAFFLVAALLIGIAIAANTVIFGLVDALLLRSLPVREPGSLVQLFEVRPSLPVQANLPEDLRLLIGNESTTMVDVMGELLLTTSLEQGTSTSRVHLGLVTDNYFEGLGIRAALGRVFDGTDDLNDIRIAVLSYSGWLRHFGGDASAVGRTVRLGGAPYQIVGVTPRGFNGTRVDGGPDFRVPYRNGDAFWNPTLNLENNSNIVARLRPGISIAAAQEEARILWSTHREEWLSVEGESISPFDRDLSVELRSIERGTSPLRDAFQGTLLLLLTGTTMLLVMVCLNVGGLMLARSMDRRQETAVRLALGASGSQIRGQWVAESVLVAALGTTTGVLLAATGGPALVQWLSSTAATGLAGFGPAPTFEFSPSRILIFVLVVTAVTVIVTTLVPAYWSRHSDLQTALKAGMSAPANRRLQACLITIQVALCTILLLAGGLMLRTLRNFGEVDAGFDQKRLVRFSIDPGIADYDDSDTWSLQQRLLESTRQLPGVEAAGLTVVPVMQGVGIVTIVVRPGQRVDDGSWNTNVNQVTPGFFGTMGIELLTGELFGPEAESADGPMSVVVNEAFALRFFGKEDPIGRVLDMGAEFENPRYRIVGLVSNANYRSLREADPPMLYWNPFGPGKPASSFSLVVRTASPETVIQPVRDLAQSIDPALPILQAVTMSDEIDRSLWQERLVAVLAASFSVFAMTLAAIGLYGIFAHYVASRRREIGLRVALGARWTHILWLVSRCALATVAVGFIAGLTAHTLAGPSIEGLLFEVSVLDPFSIIASAAFLTLVAGVAGVFPVLRAISADPVRTLREE